VNRRQLALALVAACVVGVALRTWPLWHSPLPFNPDGIIHARGAGMAVGTGHLPLAEIAPDDTAFGAFLATVALLTGVDVLQHAQGVVAVVGTIPVLVVAAAVRRIAPRAGVDGDAGRFAVALGAWTLAVEGLYLHRSMPVDEQTVGLLLAPVAVLAVAYATTRSRRWWGIAVPALAVLPAVHNLDAFVTALALTLVAGVALGKDQLGSARTITAVSLAYWTWFAGFTVGMEALTAATVIQEDRILTVPDLLVAWLVLVAVGLAWFLGRRARTKQLLLSTVLLAWFGVLAANALAPVFPGLPSTHPVILYGVAPLVVLVALFALALPDALESDAGVACLAVLAGVVTLVGVSLTASLTAEYLNTLYRVQTFAHLPVVAIAAIGAATLLGRPERIGFRNVDARTAAAVLAGVVLVASVASIPAAYGGLDVLSYKGVTTPAELQSSGFGETHASAGWTSDDHLVRIGRYYEPENVGRVTPTYAYLTGSPPPACPTMSQRSWATTGGQLFPRSPAAVSGDRYGRLTTKRHRVYATGTGDPIALTLPRGATTCRD